MKKKEIIPVEVIEQKIFLIRGEKVMLDVHLAKLYAVSTKSLNLAVKRNISRFPSDFMFQLNESEFNEVQKHLRFQSETSNWGGRRYKPYVFTEQGIAMLSSVLRSEQAIQVNIAIMRTFVKIRQILSTHKELASKLKELETKIEKHDETIQAIFEAIERLLEQPEPPKRSIGFLVEEPRSTYSVNAKKKKA